MLMNTLQKATAPGRSDGPAVRAAWRDAALLG